MLAARQQVYNSIQGTLGNLECQSQLSGAFTYKYMGLACFSYSWRQPAGLSGAGAQALGALRVSSPWIQYWVTPRTEVGHRYRLGLVLPVHGYEFTLPIAVGGV